MLVLSMLIWGDSICRAGNVTFQVDMSQQVLSGLGVHIAGDFQGWNPATNPMIDMGNGIFAVTLALTPGTHFYKFINGNAWGTDETVPTACGVNDGFGIYNRAVVVSATDLLLSAVCFAKCNLCVPGQFLLNGSAMALGGDCYQITPANAWQNGTIWSNTQLDLNYDFNLQFKINLGSIDLLGADGVVFVLQRLGSAAIGTGGGGIGYQNFGTSLGIEFDTFSNPEYNDPIYDHIAMEINGDILHGSPNNISGPVQMSSLSANTEDGSNHKVEIQWEAATHTIRVYFDCVFRLQTQSDFVNNLFAGQSLVYWGFTGATGLEYNQQNICIGSNALSPSEVTICPGGDIQLNAGASSLNDYQWTPPFYLNNAFIASPIASLLDTVVYTVTYTNLCNTPVSRVITVNASFDNPACLVLPIELISFEAIEISNEIHFEWWTASEVRNDFFTLEESLDARNFTSLLDINGNGSIQEISKYSAVIMHSDLDKYYRLRQTDLNGNSEILSQLIFVKGLSDNAISIVYQPSNEQCKVSGNFSGEMISAQVLNSLGQTLYFQKMNVQGSTEFYMPMKSTSDLNFVVIRNEVGEILVSKKIIVR